MTVRKVCSIDGCDKPAKGRGWCAAHWWRWRNHGDPLGLKPLTIKPEKCSVEGCESGPTGKRGMCNAHYLRWYRHGDTSVALRPGNGSVLAWMEKHKDYDGDDCLDWPFVRGWDGRGRCDKRYGSQQAPRVMCMMVHGKPPEPHYEAAHSCGKGHEGCINPKHLRWDTPKGNCFDKQAHGTEVRGEDKFNAVLTEDAVRHIRRKEMSVSQYAKHYGAHPETVREAQNRTTWAWLE